MANARMETQYIIHSDHSYLYKRNSHNNYSETQFRPLRLYTLSKTIILKTTTPRMAKTHTGTVNYTTKLFYNSEMRTTLQMTKTIRT